MLFKCVDFARDGDDINDIALDLCLYITGCFHLEGKWRHVPPAQPDRVPRTLGKVEWFCFVTLQPFQTRLATITKTSVEFGCPPSRHKTKALPVKIPITSPNRMGAILSALQSRNAAGHRYRTEYSKVP